MKLEKYFLRNKLCSLFLIFLSFLGTTLESRLCVCDIAALLKMTVSAISHQLKLLREANLVKTRRDGKAIFYSLADEHVSKIIEFGMEHIFEKVVAE